MTAWTLVFHLIGLVFWIGGLLIATQVFAQHSQEAAPEAREALARIERRLLRAMANPGALLTVLSGIILILSNKSYYLHASWLHAKLALVVLLIGLHGVVLSRSRAVLSRPALSGIERRTWITLHGAIALVFIGILVCVLPGQALWR